MADSKLYDYRRLLKDCENAPSEYSSSDEALSELNTILKARNRNISEEIQHCMEQSDVVCAEAMRSAWLALQEVLMAIKECLSGSVDAKGESRIKEGYDICNRTIQENSLYLILIANFLSTYQSQQDAEKKVSGFEERLGEALGKISTAEKKLEDSEHNILTHTISLIGVFSAIITVIMSAVVVEGSWLKQANEVGAMRAFAVPVAIVTVCVSFLLTLLFYYINHSSDKDTSKQEIVLILLTVIIVFAALLH